MYGVIESLEIISFPNLSSIMSEENLSFRNLILKYKFMENKYIYFDLFLKIEILQSFYFNFF